MTPELWLLSLFAEFVIMALLLAWTVWKRIEAEMGVRELEEGIMEEELNQGDDLFEHGEAVEIRLICSHCLQELRGFATLTRNDTSVFLCHEMPGLTCYRAVTVFDHPMPCFCRVADPHQRRVAQLLTGQVE